MQIPSTVSAIPSGADAVATLNGAMYPAKLLGVTLTGVSGSRAEMYLGTQRFDQTSRGMSNTADYAVPREIPAGTPVSVKWIGQAAKAAQCSATFTIER